MAGEMQFKQNITGEMTVLIHALRERVPTYFQDPEHRKEFEGWYKPKHGTDYKWKGERDSSAN